MTLLTIPAIDYHDDRVRLSASTVDCFIEDRRAFLDWLNGVPKLEEEQKSYVRGGFTHCLVLEADEVKKRYAFPPRRGEEGLAPDASKLVDRRTTEGKRIWKEFEESIAGTDKTIIMPDDEALSIGMLTAIAKHEEASGLLWGDDGINERVLYWTDRETKTPMRMRPDRLLMARRICVDIKTDRDINPDDGRNVRRWYDFGYHRKAAIYLDGLFEATGEHFSLAYIFVESTPRVSTGVPNHRVRVAWLETDSPAVEVGRAEYQETLATIARCHETAEWRHRWERERVVHEVPEWVLRKHEITAEEIFGAEVVG